MTAKQRIVLGALRDAQHANQGQAISATRVAAVCDEPWRDRRDLVTQALWLLDAQGLARPTASIARGWQITTAGRALLAPRRGPARARAPLTARRPTADHSATSRP